MWKNFMDFLPPDSRLNQPASVFYYTAIQGQLRRKDQPPSSTCAIMLNNSRKRNMNRTHEALRKGRSGS